MSPTSRRGSRSIVTAPYNQIADHDEPGRNSDAHSGDGSFELRDFLNEGKPGANRALGIMIVGLRISEVRKYAVTRVLGDKPVVTHASQFGE